MGHLERLNRYHSESLRNHEISRKLDDLKREMQRDWQDYKRYQYWMHGEEVQDNKLDMLLVYLLKKGVL